MTVEFFDALVVLKTILNYQRDNFPSPTRTKAHDEKKPAKKALLIKIPNDFDEITVTCFVKKLFYCFLVQLVHPIIITYSW